MTRGRPRLPLVMIALAGTLGAPALPAAAPTQRQPATSPETAAPDAPARPLAPSGVADLESRLEALHPEDPMAYFRLGEEVAYEMPFLAGRELARRLFVLAFELDRASEQPRGLGTSVCLALAELSTDVNEQRWLRALAEALEGSLSDVRWSASFAVGGADRAPLDLANAIGLARAGDVRHLRNMLSRFDVATVLRDAGMKPDEARSFVKHLEAVISRLRAHPPSRDIRRQTEGELVVELEPTTGGNPGPSLTEQEYLAQLRVEMLLLDGRPATWAAQMLMGGGAPLRDIDPAELAPSFAVDPARSVFRVPDGAAWYEGAWVEPVDQGASTPPRDPAQNSAALR